MSEVLIDDLIAALGEDKVLRDADVASRHSHIWKMDEPLQAICVVLPTATADVAAAMRICHAYGQPVVVHGGLTNLVGSTETASNEVVIAMEKLNTIEEIDAGSRTVTVQAGTILEHVHEAVSEYDLLFPLSFGAKGSAQIGGMISTNAGGLRVLRYGMARALVLGLEVVLADGTVVSSMKKILKDNSAYDIKQLFIGSEGTLGIITKAVLRLVEAPKSRTSAFVAFDEYEAVVSFLKYMDKGLAGTMSGYELLWGHTYAQMTTPPSSQRPPLPHGYAYYVLVEALGADQAADQQRMEDLLEAAVEQGMMVDAVMAHSATDMEWFWRIREDVHAVASQCTYDQHFDISLPIPHIGQVVEDIQAALSEVHGVKAAYPFGHIADGNIHFIVDKADESVALKTAIDHVIYSPLAGLGGSVSAEHGIGLHKKAYLSLCRSETEIALMVSLKKSLDPYNILNRGKVLTV